MSSAFLLVRRTVSRRPSIGLGASLVAALLLLVAFLAPAAALQPGPAETTLIVELRDGRTASFDIELVDDEASRAKGLMFRKSMPDTHGMLFDFRREEPVWFWMKNTYIPLDMIFVRADGTIATIATDTTPLSEATVPSKVPVRFVLEVNAGVARSLGLRPGDRLRHPRIEAAR